MGVGVDRFESVVYGERVEFLSYGGLDLNLYFKRLYSGLFIIGYNY